MGIEFTLIPIKYYTPNEVINYYLKSEIDTKLDELNTKADTSTLDTYATQEFVTTKVKEVQASAVNKDEVVEALKADEAFKTSVKGDVGPAGKDGVNPSVSDILSNEAFTNEVYKKTEVDSTFLKQADATTTYLSKNDATKTYLTKDEASNTYQPKANQ